MPTSIRTIVDRDPRKWKRKHAVMTASLFASLVYLTWRAVFTLPLQHSRFELALGILLLVCESVTIIESVNLILNSKNVKIPEMPVISADMYPEVDILVCTHNEGEDVIHKTVNGCKYMKYPDKSKVHIYICDDTNRPGMKQLADRMGVGYFGFDGNTTAKAGNLNHALARTHSSHVAIFDADMIPTSNFLLETVPYFYVPEMIRENGSWRMRTPEEREGKKPVGYVQTRQSFYNPDMLQRNLYLENNAPCDLDYFYREVNVCRMWSNSVAFGGSNTVFSRQSLDDAGGIRWSITEDMATSIEILGKGYQAIGLDKELAHGLAPDNAYSFITQRQRWSRGSAYDLTSRRFLFSPLPLRAKLGFFSSYLYWWVFFRRLVYLMCPILWGIFGIVVADMRLTTFLIVWVPYALLYSLTVRIMSDGTQTATWSNIVDTVQMPYLLFSVVQGTLKLPGSTFKVTPKDRLQGRNSSIELAIPHMILTVLSFVAIYYCSIQVFVYKYQGAVIPLFWLVFNLYALLNAVVYYRGRTNSRYHERIPVALPVAVMYGGRTLRGVTSDISEGGLAVLLDEPEYLPYNSGFFVETERAEYKARFKATVGQVRQIGDKWQYSLVITGMPEKSGREYYQILYDRDHSLPRAVDMNVFSDAKRIARGMTAQPERSERRLPRIDVRIKAVTHEGATADIVNFNYKYVMFRKGRRLPSRVSLRLENGTEFTCFRAGEKDDARGDGEPLFEIEHWETLAVDPRFREFLMQRLRRGARAENRTVEGNLA